MVKPPLMEIACPVCSKPVKTSERYPRSLCPECSALVTDRSGRPVVFYDIQVLPTPNSSGVTLLGGFYGYYANTGLQETYSSSTCYVDGITCEAKNARFGGIEDGFCLLRNQKRDADDQQHKGQRNGNDEGVERRAVA